MRSRTFGKIIGHLIHIIEDLDSEEGEKKIFYKALREKDPDNLQPYEGVEEHHLAIQVLKELQKGSLAKSQITAKMKVLKEALLHHIMEEETEYFKTAKKIFNSAELDEMGKKFIEKKDAFLEHRK